MKSCGHIYLAHLLYNELLNNDGWLALRTVPDADGRSEVQRYRLEDPIYWAIRNHRGCFFAGAVGPDFFPDLLNGQMRIHPRDSGKWLEMMFEELRKINPNTPEFQRAVAFYMGWLVHYSTDMYTHQYVNRHSFGWFPSITEMAGDLRELTGSEQIKTLAACANRHLSDAEGLKLLQAENYLGCVQKLMTDPAAIEELKNILCGQGDYKDFGEYQASINEMIDGLVGTFRDLQDRMRKPGFDRTEMVNHLTGMRYFLEMLRMRMGISAAEIANILDSLETAITEMSRTDPWVDKVISTIDKLIDDLEDHKPEKFIIKLLENAVQLVRLANSALNIFRHMMIEAYLDATIQERLEKHEGFDADAFYAMEIPDDFLRRCFTTPAAYHRMLDLSHDDNYQAKDNPLDVLGRFVEYYEEEFRKMIATGGDQHVLADLKLRRDYLNRWVDFWRKFVMNDMIHKAPIPEGQQGVMAADIREFSKAYLYADEDEIREAENQHKHLFRLYGLFRNVDLIPEIVEECFEQILLWMIEPILKELEELVTPILEKIARILVQMDGYPGIDDPEKVSGFDESLEVIRVAMENPRFLLQCEALFWTEGLADRFDEEWKYLCGANDNCFSQRNPMVENSLQMSKLCLLGVHNLNDLFCREVADAKPFHSSDVRWTLSELLVEVMFPQGGFTRKGFKLRLDVTSRDKQGVEKTCHRAVIFDAAKKLPDQIIKAEIPLTEPLTAQELSQCFLTVLRDDKVTETALVKVNLYDKQTGLRLFTKQGYLYNQNAVRMELLPADKHRMEMAFRDQMENALMVNSLSKLRVTVHTGTDGTDDGVRFCVLNKKNNVISGPFNLDRGRCYNDFEAGDIDLYEVDLPKIIDVADVGGFGIYKTSEDNDWQVRRIRVAVDVDGHGNVITVADYNHNNQSIRKTMVTFPLDRWRLKAPELGLVREVRQLQVAVRTSSEWWSGTDHDVYLEVMRGTKSLYKVQVDSSQRNDFERGNLDAFYIDITTNGKGIMSDQITGFRITKEKGGYLHEDDWTVEQIIIHDGGSGFLMGLYTTKPGEKPFVFTSGNNKLSIYC